MFALLRQLVVSFDVLAWPDMGGISPACYHMHARGGVAFACDMLLQELVKRVCGAAHR